MEALGKAFLLGVPALHAGQTRHSAVHYEQQQPLFLHCSYRYHPLAQVGHALAVEAPPSPAPPTLPTASGIQNPNLADFILVSLGLLVLFWIGNYVVPDFIFTKLFGSDTGTRNDTQKQKVLDGLVGGIDKTASQVASGADDATVRGAGFGRQASKIRKPKK